MPTKLEPLSLAGAYLIHPTEFADERGLFSVLYEAADLKTKGLSTDFVQQSLSISKKNVIRAFHYQIGKHSQAKLVRCIKGEIWDVIVDLRKSSLTFGEWQGFTLSEANRLAVYIPRGFAHGFVAMSDEATMLYQIDKAYAPKEEGGVRYDDPTLAVRWPVKEPLLSPKDLKWPLLKDAKLFD